MISSRAHLQPPHGLPARLRSCTFETWDASVAGAVPDELRSFPDGRGAFLVLTGPVGTGKTHLAAASFRMHVDDGSFLPLWWSAADWLAALRESFGHEGATARSEDAEAVRTCPILYLDDLGAERVTEWSRSSLWSVLSYRWDNMLATCVTTNLDRGAMEQLDARLASRLFGAEARQVSFAGVNDFRRRAR